jgi:hypothetical protein
VIKRAVSPGENEKLSKPYSAADARAVSAKRLSPIYSKAEKRIFGDKARGVAGREREIV